MLNGAAKRLMSESLMEGLRS